MTPGSGTLADTVAAALREAAETAILPRYRQLGGGHVRAKTSAADLVTVADEDSERFLTRALAALLPGSRVVGEEAAFADPSVLSALEDGGPVWIVDPIDGTANFVAGEGAFGIIAALAQDGETRMGWIYFPLDHTVLFAEHGAGTWRASLAGGAAPRWQPQRVPRPAGAALSDMTASIYHKALTPAKGKFARVVRLGCSAHDYLSLVDGSLHVSSYNRLKPWDHAAGTLIHAEAGGFNRLLSGAPYRPRPVQAGILCAPSHEVWDAVAQYQRG